jgi:hypothetical protein
MDASRISRRLPVAQVSKERLDAVLAKGFPASAAAGGAGVGTGGDVVIAVPGARVQTEQQHGWGGGGGYPRRPAYSQGSYSPQHTGFARLVWDNTYSRLNGKHIAFAVQAVGEDALQVSTYGWVMGGWRVDGGMGGCIYEQAAASD